MTIRLDFTRNNERLHSTTRFCGDAFDALHSVFEDIELLDLAREPGTIIEIKDTQGDVRVITVFVGAQFTHKQRDRGTIAVTIDQPNGDDVWMLTMHDVTDGRDRPLKLGGMNLNKTVSQYLRSTLAMIEDELPE